MTPQQKVGFRQFFRQEGIINILCALADFCGEEFKTYQASILLEAAEKIKKSLT